MHSCARIHDHVQMLCLITRCEHGFFDGTTYPADLARVASLAARADSEDPLGDKTSLKIAARARDQVVPLQMKPELTSTQLAKRRNHSLDMILLSVADP